MSISVRLIKEVMGYTYRMNKRDENRDLVGNPEGMGSVGDLHVRTNTKMTRIVESCGFILEQIRNQWQTLVRMVVGSSVPYKVRNY